jgi:hypothetical protein
MALTTSPRFDPRFRDSRRSSRPTTGSAISWRLHSRAPKPRLSWLLVGATAGQDRHAEKTSRTGSFRGGPFPGFVWPRRLARAFRNRRGLRQNGRHRRFASGGRHSWLGRRRRLGDSATGWRTGGPAGRWRSRPDRLRLRGSAGRVLFRQRAGLCSSQPGWRLRLPLGHLCLSAEYRGRARTLPARGSDRNQMHLPAFHLPGWICYRLHLRYGHLHLPLARGWPRWSCARVPILVTDPLSAPAQEAQVNVVPLCDLRGLVHKQADPVPAVVVEEQIDQAA